MLTVPVLAMPRTTPNNDINNENNCSQNSTNRNSDVKGRKISVFVFFEVRVF